MDELFFCEQILNKKTNGNSLFYKILRHKFGNEYVDRCVFNDFKERLRNRCWLAFKRIKENKPYNTEKILGADFNTIKKHIENQFKENMSWDNMGKNGWVIDHIKPLALAKTKEELLILCNYKNLQPMWEKENKTKSSIYNGKRVTYKHNIQWMS
jgi:hypothetical protein